MGWSYSGYDPFAIPSNYEFFNCLKNGRARRAYNVFSGNSGGLGFKAFDYQYTTGSGKSSPLIISRR